MALAYVYRHRNGGNNSDYVGISGKPLINGQIIFFTGDVWPYSEEGGGPYLHVFYYYDIEEKRWLDGFIVSNRSSYPPNDVETVNAGGDKIYVISQFNWRVYGSKYVFKTSIGNGTHYGLRRLTALLRPKDDIGTSWEIVEWMYPDYRVIIGPGQGVTRSNVRDQYNRNYNMLRCWGYIKPDGTVVETFGLYVYIYDITYHPAEYALNTR